MPNDPTKRITADMGRRELLEALKDLIEVNRTAHGVSKTFTRLLLSLEAYVRDSKRAAAPELYAALETLLRTIEEIGSIDRGMISIVEVDLAQKALAKAREEQTNAK